MIMLSLLDRTAISRALASPQATAAFTLVKRGQSRPNTAAPVALRYAASPSTPVPPGRRTRSPQTTNTERKLADLEQDVLDGVLTPREACRIFGRKPAGSGGRSRAPGQEDFRAWIAGRIDRLSDPAGLARLADQIARLRQDHTLTSARRGALVREINRRSWQYDPEYVDRLRAVLAELDDCALAA